MLDIFHKYIIKFISQIHQSNGYNTYTIQIFRSTETLTYFGELFSLCTHVFRTDTSRKLRRASSVITLSRMLRDPFGLAHPLVSTLLYYSISLLLDVNEVIFIFPLRQTKQTEGRSEMPNK